MTFTVRDFHDLVEILEKEPAWRAEVRRLVLTDEILGLPQAVRDLTTSVQELSELQRHNEARFGRVEVDIADVKTDVSQIKTNVGKLETNVGKLETNVGKLETRMGKVETTVDKLETRMGKVETNVAKLNGRDLERLLRERPFVYLSRFARRLKAVSDAELAVLLEDAVENDLITEDEAEDAKLLDAVARGRRRADAALTYLAIEVCVVVDQHDLARAIRRAAVLEKASHVPVLPVVAGENVLDNVRQAAEHSGAGWVILAQTN